MLFLVPLATSINLPGVQAEGRFFPIFESLIIPMNYSNLAFTDSFGEMTFNFNAKPMEKPPTETSGGDFVTPGDNFDAGSGLKKTFTKFHMFLLREQSLLPSS